MVLNIIRGRTKFHGNLNCGTCWTSFGNVINTLPILLLLMLLLLLVPVLILLLLLLAYYEQNNIAYSNGVLAVDEGKMNTELTFSCNIRSTTTSINDYIYTTPDVQAKDNRFYNSQLVL